LPTVRNAPTALGYDEHRLQALLREVGAAYQSDRGQGLVAAASDELDPKAERTSDLGNEAPQADEQSRRPLDAAIN
jgi:hypothetical protein